MTTKKSYYCTNCNKNNHDFKDCREPITSWGVILVNLSNFNITSLEHTDNTNLKQKIFSIYPQNHKDLEHLSIYMNNIKFLMVQRRHSFGFMDFIRGKYDIDNIDKINSLFQNMNKKEIELINIHKDNFDELWNEMWNNDPLKINKQRREYIIAKQQFDNLKNSDNIDQHLNLDFYINNISPLFNYNEWGFPKGRKDKNESGLSCALREFGEETGIDVDKIKLINSIVPIEENLIGTNGLPYRHIYYICEIYQEIEHDIKNNNEIGDLCYFNYNETQQVIRDYHVEKKNILQNLFMYYLELLLTKNNNMLVSRDENKVIKINEL